MDVLLRDGDLVFNHGDAPVMVDGVGELLQRAAIRLTVRRGTLPHDRSFGSDLHQLNAPGNRALQNQRAFAAVRQALAPIREIEVRAAECRYEPDVQRLTVRVLLELLDKSYALEVSL